MTRLRHLIALAIASTSVSATAFGDVVTYTVDPSRSSLTLSGTYEGDPLQPQSGVPDSLTASYTGTITTNTELTTNTLQITSGTIAAQITDASSPLNKASANYGFTNSPGFIFKGSIAGLSFSLSSEALDSITNFDVSQISVAITTGLLDYTAMPGGNGGAGGGETGGSLPMSGTLNLAPASASLTELAGIQTLTLPIETSFTANIPGLGNTMQPIELDFSGVIIATTTVPEPTSLSLFFISAVLCRRRI